MIHFSVDGGLPIYVIKAVNLEGRFFDGLRRERSYPMSDVGKDKASTKTIVGYPLRSPAAPTLPGLIGRTLGKRYRIVERLAESSTGGAVYRAEHTMLERYVAVKVIRQDLDPEGKMLRRFRREAKIVQRLTHPNTVRIYDYGETEDALSYIVMELLEGRTLDVASDDWGALPLSMVCAIGEQVLGSLTEAHELNIIHRDVTPDNIMLVEQLGTKNHVKLLDFGVAGFLSEVTVSFIYRPGSDLGSPVYMSPEQLRNHSVDGRSDLYSLGHTLFHLATGRPAYRGSIFEVARQHMCADELALPPLLENTRLGRIVRRATRKMPNHRFPTAQEMLHELSGRAPVATVSSVAVTTGPTRIPPIPKQFLTTRSLRRLALPFWQRPKWIVAALALVVVAVVAFFVLRG